MTLPKRALILASVSTPEQAADEKQSLDAQERDMREIAARYNWQIFDVLRIPGFSRDYISWEECAQDMLKEGVTALVDLKRYCEQNAFDVFMIRDADRFGRTQSLVMQIAETIGRKMHKSIYSQIDGLIEPENCRMWAMLAGYRAAGEMDKKLLYYRTGMEPRAERGLHDGTTPWFQRTIRDPENGKALRVELREDYRYIWDAVFKALVVERIGFGYLEQVLFERFQIIDPRSGRPFRRHAIYDVLCMNPSAWGHRYRGKKRHKRNKEGGLSGEWVYDRNVSPPDDIKLYYDVLPAIYTGQQAADMMDELRRRREIRGSMKPTHPSTFSGLLICDYCGNHLVYNNRPEKNWRAYRCQTHERHRMGAEQDCACKPKSIRFEKLEAWLRPFLEQLIAGVSVDTMFPLPSSTAENDLAALEQQVAAVETEKTHFIERLGLIPDSMLPEYHRQMQQLAERSDQLQSRLNTLKTVSHSQNRSGQLAALNDLIHIGADAFWELEAGRQQQILKRLFATWRIIVADGEVVSVAQTSKHPRRTIN